ncbi:MAG: MBL fold metallo-hydrolase [Planctomycetes bacterium]|nr:MBL fold metallo-hydrolase [Planctomycetota bacterium]
MGEIEKVDVAPGVYWVEIASANLRIQCGCPSDSVKHLMRRGLIVPRTIKGVACDSGPNAILLSDMMIQNGDLCNLCEFPILQMFYRQGMIIPKHPGNTGVKPLLIGSSEQIRSQLQYIYRGNYGLISAEELVASGLSPETAELMMNFKTKFAFGKITHPRELLDTVTVGSGETVIRPGVSIRRIEMNVFEFSCGDETVTVDLNLKLNQRFGLPYNLNHHKIERGDFSVIHSGDGDGWDVNRLSMSSILIFQGRIFLVDAGPNLEHSLNALGIGINEISGVFHTHCHDDHFSGLTSLIKADHRIRYFATPFVRSSVSKKLAALLSIEESDFGKYFEVHDLFMNEWNDVDGLEVMPLYSPHPVEDTIFNFRAMWQGGYKTSAH